ncbi:MAG: hypothetical protein CL920_16810 [Deltaproteobacteria bacterium]|nr:hypothetical protein [Deltaproteobacteria bacterium]MBU50342.1 hypothetical protein [Deltaproteobacteria bacterium]|tara:strand:+ start:11211 stop:11549 length:339 start_codon:yes stop_codon:yes gene_type:complete
MDLKGSILKKLSMLPVEKQRAVLDYVEFLWLRYADVVASEEKSSQETPPTPTVAHVSSPLASAMPHEHDHKVANSLKEQALSEAAQAHVTQEDIAEASSALNEWWFPSNDDD